MGGLLQPSSCTDASLAELVLDNALKEYSVPVWADPLLDSILGVNCPLEKDRAVGRGEGTCADACEVCDAVRRRESGRSEGPGWSVAGDLKE